MSFNTTNGNGPNENAPLVQGADGNLYGVNFGGGYGNSATVSALFKRLKIPKRPATKEPMAK